MFMFQTLKYLPPHILGIEGELVGILGFGIAAFVLLFVPFLDRGRHTRATRDIWTYLVLIALTYMLLLTYLGYRMSATA
jgi:quinol-cytochrome oxidoreductase complex cytochrome b subunit